MFDYPGKKGVNRLEEKSTYNTRNLVNAFFIWNHVVYKSSGDGVLSRDSKSRRFDPRFINLKFKCNY
jgi:hypothetical protein